MKVTLRTELWMVEDDYDDGRGLALIRPYIRHRGTEEGAPGAATGVLRVLRPGTVVEIPDD